MRTQVMNNGDLIAEGKVREAAPAPADEPIPEGVAPHRGGPDAAEFITGPAFYGDLARNRVQYGESFQMVEEIAVSGDCAMLRSSPPCSAFLSAQPEC